MSQPPDHDSATANRLDPRSEPPGRAAVWRRPLEVIRGNARTYLVLNVATYGLVVLGFAAGLLFPQLSQDRATALQDDGTADLVGSVVSRPPLFALLIFAVNLFRLSLLTIVVPSLIVPFAGLAFFGYWLVQTGVTLVPATGEGWVAMIPHSLTIVIELQAYIVFALGAFLIGRYWLRPRSAGVERRRDGYVAGLRTTGVLAVPAVALLVVGAVWEAYSLRYFIHPLSQWLL
ncbi:stage II sporulation protein M [Curtobacterium sp. MCLR17_007]|uniref:stage II sporulation protein M n=1 Tax=Curtobacterium sp. MCLR17_007 TaxID=2175648 RepID=UPI000DA83FF1|nr:stage II sporulation protein M [Curtobacterium sp. MCLR17_007]WIB60205.1 stage II sporulation protein M [Curtobacterium sp. MCLR17_007]